jgi:hypothetical protein
MEAEYVALLKDTKYLLWLNTALKDLQFPEPSMALGFDNRSVIDLAENYQISELYKHIHFHHHHVQEIVYDKILLLLYSQTMDNLADMYPKGLTENQLSKYYAIT